MRLILLIIFFWSYLPVYLWSISPRHNFLPSLIICIFIAYLLSGVVYSKINFILKNIERTYEAAARFVKALDKLSLMYKKKINNKIINQALNNII